MKCPYCQENMESGVLSGHGGSKVHWISDQKKGGFLDKLFGEGSVEASYSAGFPTPTFRIYGHYCSNCKKIILDTEVYDY